MDEVALSFSNLFAALRASIVQQLYAIWFGMGSYRGSDMDSWLDLSLPMISAAQETAVNATATYVSLQLEAMGASNSEVVIPPAEFVTGAALRNGVPPEEVYSRPMKEVWTALSQGKDIAEAIRMGADRLRQLVETDIQLAHTHTARTIFRDRRDVMGFRRVPTGLYTCALCLVASTQRYRKLDLMPIHPGCDCRVAPIISEDTIPRVVDKETLDRIHNAIAEQFGISARDARGIDYRKILLVENHGEYGPTLTVAKHKFTGPSDLKGKEAPSWSTDLSDFTGNNVLALR